MNLFESDNLTALEAKEKAQWIAFAPVVFQATRVLRNTGILSLVAEHTEGLTQAEIAARTNLPHYGIRVLLEAGLGIGLMVRSGERYKTTKTATFILHDQLTRVNIDFVHDVCYNGMFFLEESIRNQKPEGLKVFGDWPTVYEGLAKLPAAVRKSWFAFDHFYSDTAFPEVLPHVFSNKPQSVLDIGGNTGRWAVQCFQYDPSVVVTIMDLPGQVDVARREVEAKGFAQRISFHEANVLDSMQPMPGLFDVIWLSQFLDCFSESEIAFILQRCRTSLKPGGRVFILEPFWDRQRFAASAFALQQTSLYFTAIANGNSQMYHSDTMRACVERAGFLVENEMNGIGVSHTLWACVPQA